MARRYEGKSVFITGGSSGIGAALGKVLAAQGARVALAARRADRLEAVCEGIRRAGGEALPLVCDVTDRASLDAAVARTVEAWGGLDVAVANAGFGVSGRFASLDTAAFERQFAVNVLGVVDTIYATLPHLERSRGRLGIVSSVMGYLGAPATVPYCASKFAVRCLAESLYYELADAGVSVTCICPGLVASEIRFIDNDGRLRPDGIDPAPGFLIVPAERAARSIAAALYRRKPEVVVTGHGKLMVALVRHAPRLMRFLVRRATRGRLDEVEARKRAH